MKTSHYFSHFCKVQHRLQVSPRAAALFFFILGEISVTEKDTNSVALTNSRICGTIHTSHAALRRCREELIAAGIIIFQSTDNGKSLSLYTLCETENWQLDVIMQAPVPQIPAAQVDPDSLPESTAISERSERSEASEYSDFSEISESKGATEISETAKITDSSEPKPITKKKIKSTTLPQPYQDKLQSISDTMSRQGGRRIKCVYQPRHSSRHPHTRYSA